MIYGPLQRGEEDLKIGEVVMDRSWNWSKLSMELPTEVLIEIKAMPFSCISHKKDMLIWAASSNGEFNLSSAYNLANKLPDPSITFNGKWIWKMKVLPKIQSFIWMCYHNSIATRDCLAKRGIQVSSTCPRCF